MFYTFQTLALFGICSCHSVHHCHQPLLFIMGKYESCRPIYKFEVIQPGIKQVLLKCAGGINGSNSQLETKGYVLRMSSTSSVCFCMFCSSKDTSYDAKIGAEKSLTNNQELLI